MIAKTNDDLLKEISGLFAEYLKANKFGEFSVSLTLNQGKPVKLTTTERESIVRYGSKRIMIEK